MTDPKEDQKPQDGRTLVGEVETVARRGRVYANCLDIVQLLRQGTGDSIDKESLIGALISMHQNGTKET